MPHFTEEERKVISNMISNHKTAREIGEALSKDPTAISKEIKRNRKISKLGKGEHKFLCKKLDRFPYVCVDCKYKYTTCTLTQMAYNSHEAQVKADYRLHNSREGINMSPEEHKLLNDLLTLGLRDKKSIYQIVHENNIKVSVPTVYRYISEKKIDIKKIDLPYAVKYKVRKSHKKEYDYSKFKIDRSNRTFLDYLSYIKSHLNEMTVQMDFLGSIKSDKSSILVLVIPPLQFCFLFIIEKKNSNKVVELFNSIQEKLGIKDFKNVFPSILTDRDPSFSDFIGIEFDPINGEKRTNVFYCDAYKSSQKANVENINKQLRQFFPKKSSIDSYTQNQVFNINKTINQRKLYSLDGQSPEEAFITVFGSVIFNKIFN